MFYLVNNPFHHNCMEIVTFLHKSMYCKDSGVFQIENGETKTIKMHDVEPLGEKVVIDCISYSATASQIEVINQIKKQKINRLPAND